MKVSVCVNVLNEEGSIGALLESLLNQSKSPDEIVVVDARSRDKTVKIIKKYKNDHPEIRLIVEPGSIAHGRNTAIKKARNEIIAMTDAGCVARHDWLEKIRKPFKDERTGLVAGFYSMASSNSMQKAMNAFHGVVPKQFDEKSFLPSARSFAIRKSVWQTLGGFSEKLKKAGEDTLFFHNAVKKNVKIVRVKEAIVEWQEPSTFSLGDSAKKFYQYALGDAQAGIWWHPEKQLASHNIKITLIFVRYFLGLILLLLAFDYPLLFLMIGVSILIYSIWAFFKVYRLTSDINAGFYGIIVQFTADVSVMTGFIKGLISLI